MIKIAFFVEGLTEQIFVNRLLLEIFGANNISITTILMSGGSTSKLNKQTISTLNCQQEIKYTFLIYNCSSDSTVKSYILEERATLIKANYSKIIGLLDLFPKTKEDFNRFLTGLQYQTPTKDITIKYIISVMEVESWFLGEDTHFERIDSELTITKIESNLGFNPSTECMEERDHPSLDLNNCYQLVGKAYNKTTKHISRTVDNLDISHLYINKREILSSLNELITEIESLL